MSDAVQIGKWATLHCGDCLAVLPMLEAGSVQCCVTSPPYWGLRDYGIGGQVGLEPTPDEYVARVVAVFREVRRVLRDDGTLWLNLGDSYASSGTYDQTASERLHDWSGDGKHRSKNERSARAGKGRAPAPPGLKPKDLVGIPWRVAFALQADGWYLRQDIIWAKVSPMPESVTDRCTKAHEYVFLLAKSERYHYDAEAIKEPAVATPQRRLTPSKVGGYREVPGRTPQNGDGVATRDEVAQDYQSRNRRSVWTIPTRPYSGAHFAVMPPDLVEPCILAGCPAGGVVLDPFTGSGTVGAVALSLGRKFVGVELNPEYVALAHKRISNTQPSLFGQARPQVEEVPG